MLFLSKFDDFMNSLFKDANGNFDLKIFFALLIGIIIGIVVTSSIYGLLVLISLKKESKKINIPENVNDEEIIKMTEFIIDNFKLRAHNKYGITELDKTIIFVNELIDEIEQSEIEFEKAKEEKGEEDNEQ